MIINRNYKLKQKLESKVVFFRRVKKIANPLKVGEVLVKA